MADQEIINSSDQGPEIPLKQKAEIPAEQEESDPLLEDDDTADKKGEGSKNAYFDDNKFNLNGHEISYGLASSKNSDIVIGENLFPGKPWQTSLHASYYTQNRESGTSLTATTYTDIFNHASKFRLNTDMQTNLDNHSSTLSASAQFDIRLGQSNGDNPWLAEIRASANTHGTGRAAAALLYDFKVAGQDICIGPELKVGFDGHVGVTVNAQNCNALMKPRG